MTTPHYQDGPVTIYHGDCINIMRELPDASIDAVVTDPPYGLEFMGRDWDGADGFRRSLNVADVGRNSVYGRTSRTSPEYRAGHLFQTWCEQWAAECYRLLKPGGHLLAFGGTRTFHRLASGIEDAEFEIRDSIAWLYGSGFPKSLDVSKAIDATELHGGSSSRKLREAEQAGGGTDYVMVGKNNGIMGETVTVKRKTWSPQTEQGRAWQGWGTALKPAFEPIVVARKPLDGTVAGNVLAYGTGALNIDACRIEMSEADAARIDGMGGFGKVEGFVPNQVFGAYGPSTSKAHTAGRWPANVILDESQAAALDEQSGQTTSTARTGSRSGKQDTTTLGRFTGQNDVNMGHNDTGGASRFFYSPKAAGSERPNVDGVAHPTVKPVDLMRWLVRLVTPPGGTVLEPFAGSGTTVEAAILENFNCIAIEREDTYIPLIMKRVQKPHHVGFDFDWSDT